MEHRVFLSHCLQFFIQVPHLMVFLHMQRSTAADSHVWWVNAGINELKIITTVLRPSTSKENSSSLTSASVLWPSS